MSPSAVYDTNELVQAQATAKAGLLLLPIPVLSAWLQPWNHRHPLCRDSSFPSLAPGSGTYMQLTMQSLENVEDKGMSIIIELAKLWEKPASTL